MDGETKPTPPRDEPKDGATELRSAGSTAFYVGYECGYDNGFRDACRSIVAGFCFALAAYHFMRFLDGD